MGAYEATAATSTDTTWSNGEKWVVCDAVDTAANCNGGVSIDATSTPILTNITGRVGIKSDTNPVVVATSGTMT